MYAKLQKIASISGNASQSAKTDLVKSLLVACRGAEARYLIRSCSGKLRIGVSEQTVLAAIARAIHFHELETGKKFDKEKCAKTEAKIKEAFSELPNYEILMKAILEHGSEDLDQHVTLQPGVPLKVNTLGVIHSLQLTRFHSAHARTSDQGNHGNLNTVWRWR